MKILIANKYFFRNGGSEAVMFHERDFLQQQGVEVVDFSMHDERNHESRHALNFVSNQDYAATQRTAGNQVAAAFKLIHSFEAVTKIGTLIDVEKPDIVHCHNIYHQLTPSIIGAAKRRGVPVVLTLHDYKTVCPTYLRLRGGQVCSDCLDNGFRRVIANRCADNSFGKSALLYAEAVVQKLLGNYEMVDIILAPSKFLMESVSPRRFPRERVRLLYNGIDVRSVTVSGKDGGYILYVGRLSQEKGVRTLLEAHAILNGNTDLVVAGTGPLEQNLKQEFPRVRFLGHVTGEALYQAMENSSVVIAPSECYENCPMSVLEAMAFGKAVIASNIGGIPELVVHGETGLLFEAGDKEMLRRHMLSLMEDSLLRHRYGAAGRQRAKSYFSMERHNNDLMTVYRSLLRQPMTSVSAVH